MACARLPRLQLYPLVSRTSCTLDASLLYFSVQYVGVRQGYVFLCLATIPGRAAVLAPAVLAAEGNERMFVMVRDSQYRTRGRCFYTADLRVIAKVFQEIRASAAEVALAPCRSNQMGFNAEISEIIGRFEAKGYKLVGTDSAGSVAWQRFCCPAPVCGVSLQTYWGDILCLQSDPLCCGLAQALSMSALTWGRPDTCKRSAAHGAIASLSLLLKPPRERPGEQLLCMKMSPSI